MTTTPLEDFKQSWTKAKEAKDPNAPFCTLATVTEDGFPMTRTVGLREVDDEKGTVLLFINDTSPKYRQLEATSKFELLCFWNNPDMIQYRMRGDSWKTLDDQDMEQRWRNKPKTSQLLDYYYSHCQPQSSVLRGGRQEFVETMRKLKEEFKDKEVPFQPIATGLVLELQEIEEWRGSPTDRLHERYMFQKTASGSWEKKTLVP